MCPSVSFLHISENVTPHKECSFYNDEIINLKPDIHSMCHKLLTVKQGCDYQKLANLLYCNLTSYTVTYNMFLNTMWNKKCKTSASWLYTWAASHINSGQPNSNIQLPQETRFYCSMTSKTPQQRPDPTVWTNGCRLDMSSDAGALHDLHLKGVYFSQYGCAAHGKLVFLTNGD